MNTELLPASIHCQLGVWLSTGSPIITEMASQQGFDWLLLDLEHGFCTESMILSNLQAVQGNTQLIIRVGSLNTALIGRVLDWGASGIMLPHTCSAEKAIECVRSMYYPPSGNRGFSSSARVFDYGVTTKSNIISPLLMVQIETCEAVHHCEAIAAVPGVDVLFIGPADLKLDIAIHGNDTGVAFEQALQQVSRAAKKYQKKAGVVAKTKEEALYYASLGYTFIACGSDIGFLREGFSNALDQRDMLQAK